MEDESHIYRETVAAEVRALMARRKVRQGEVMKLLDMSQPAVSRRLNGDLPFTTDDLFAIARHFGVKLSSLLPEPVEVGKVDGATAAERRWAARIARSVQPPLSPVADLAIAS